MAQIAYRLRPYGPIFEPEDIRAMFDREISAALLELGALAQRMVVERAPAGVSSGGGGFRGSVFSELRGQIAERSMIVSSPLVYAQVLEVGRRPGKRPPIAPILLWVRRKLGKTGSEAASVAFLVARKIGKSGYAGKNMFLRATLALDPIATARFKVLVTLMARRLGGGGND